eukprot:3551518-Prymnesium_polylepis.1
MVMLVQVTASSGQLVWMLTQNTQASNGLLVQPEHAGAWTWARAVRAEVSKCSLLSVDLVMGPHDATPHLKSVEPETVLSAAATLVPRLGNCRMSEGKRSQSNQIEKDHASIHLVTGGTGALGLVTSRWLANLTNSHVFVGSRTGSMPTEFSASVSGLQLNTMVCNVAEAADVQRFATCINREEPFHF